MHRDSKFILKLLGVLLVAAVAWHCLSLHLKKRTDYRCAAEGQAAVEDFLRDGAGGALSVYGTFRRLDGTGYSYPVWNILQGDQYLTLDRTGVFSQGVVHMRIYVTAGRLPTSSTNRVGKPRIEGPVLPPQTVQIFVAHSDLKP